MNRKPLFLDEEIYNYIPQRPPIVMVDKLYESSIEKTITGLTVQSDNIFTEDGKLQAPGLIENIAQSSALSAGYYYKSQNKEVPLGFIASIKNLRVHELPNIGATLETEVVKVRDVLNVSIVEGTVRHKDQVLATCEMRIYILEETPN